MLTLEQRLLSKIEKQDQPDGCWIWRCSTTTKGYGQIRVAGYYMLAAHRVAYEIWVGRIPEGLSLRHTCKNPRCCNPTHLVAETQYSIACGRTTTKLKTSEAGEIKWLLQNTSKTQAAIARSYGVSASTVHDIKRGFGWADAVPVQPTIHPTGE